MQRIAREFNLSETLFILPSKRTDCAVRFRIFTTTMEMRFAGHPTIGGAFVALQCGLVDRQMQRFFVEEPVGAVPVRVESGALRIWLTTPPITFGARFDRGMCAEVLGLKESKLADSPPQLVSAGNPNIFVAVRDTASVDRAWLDLRVSDVCTRGRTVQIASSCLHRRRPAHTRACSLVSTASSKIRLPVVPRVH